MKRKRLTTMMVMTLALGIVVLGPAVVNAVPTLELFDGATLLTIADGSGLDSNPTAGVVTFIGSIGVWSINVTTGLTKPAAGSALIPYMDLNTLNRSTAGGTLTLEFSEKDFGPDLTGGFEARIGGTTAGSMTYDTYVDAGNGLFTHTILLTSLGPFGGAFSGSATGLVGPLAFPYSLTQVITITHQGAGISSGNAELFPVPEPSALLLLGSGMAALGLFRRRKV